MKNKILKLFCMFSILIACKGRNISDTELLGKWRLVEVLADPGDGSGTFQPVISNKTIIFYSDGSIFASEKLCAIVEEERRPALGTFSLSDSTITLDGCTQYKYNFEHKGNFLILVYPCIEPCGEKYKKQS